MFNSCKKKKKASWILRNILTYISLFFTSRLPSASFRTVLPPTIIITSKIQSTAWIGIFKWVACWENFLKNGWPEEIWTTSSYATVCFLRHAGKLSVSAFLPIDSKKSFFAGCYCKNLTTSSQKNIKTHFSNRTKTIIPAHIY